MTMNRPAMFTGKKPSSALPVEAPAPLDLGGLPPSAPHKDFDQAAVQRANDRVGFTDRDPEVPPAHSPSGAELVAVLASPSTTTSRRAPRSGRNTPVNLKATPEYRTRFFDVCDRMSDLLGRAISQAEGFEMAVAALEREAAAKAGSN